MITFTNEHLAGMLPMFLDAKDPRGAVAQLHESYAHGGGWQPFKGFTLAKADRNALGVFRPGGQFLQLEYPEDPPMMEISRGHLREEVIVLFQYNWVAVVQPSGEYEIARID